MYLRSLIYLGILVVALPVRAAEPENRVTTSSTEFEDERTPSGFSTRIDTSKSAEEGRDLADALRWIPGVNIRRTSSLGQPAFVTVRGSNARQVAVSLDGQRISAPFGPGFDLGSFSVAGVESIDLHRGSAGIARGSGALSGALDLKTRVRKTPGWGANATSLFGSWDTYGANADADFAQGQTAARLSGNWRQSAGDYAFVDPQGTRLDRINNDSLQGGGLFTLQHRFGKNNQSKAKLNVSYQASERGVSGPSEFQESFSDARLKDSRLLANARVEERAVVDKPSFGLDLYQGLGIQKRDLLYQNTTTILGEGTQTNTTDFLSFQGSAGATAYVGKAHLLHLDTDLRAETYASVLSGVNVGETDADRMTLGVGASEEFFILDNMSLIASGRGEFIWGSLEESAFLPALGAMVRAQDWLSFKTNVARTYRAPDFDELYLDIETIRGNPDLESERAWAWDGGAILGSEVWSVEAVYFGSLTENAIAFVPVSSYVVEATNLQDVQVHGLESLASIRPTKRWLISSGYTYTHARRAESPDTQVPHQPEHQGFARAEVELGRNVTWLESLLFRTDINYRSESNLDSFGNLKAPGYATLDFVGNYAPTDWASVGVSLLNVLDNQTRVDGLQRPLPGRSLYTTLTLHTSPQ